MAGCSRDFDMVPDGMDSEDDDDNRIDPEVQQFCENFTFENVETCWICNGYYGPSYEEPVCGTCHSFLFADPAVGAPQVTRALSDDEEDSGNDEPPFIPPASAAGSNQVVNAQRNNVARARGRDEADVGEAENVMDEEVDDSDDINNIEEAELIVRANDQLPRLLDWPDAVGARHRDLPLDRPVPNAPRNVGHYLDILSNVREANERTDSKIGNMPPEVLLNIFKYLDDLSLAHVSQTCRRWRTIIQTHTSEKMWYQYTKKRWPLFQQIATVSNWLETYLTLMDSCFCRTCLIEMAQKTPHHEADGAFNVHKIRLRNENNEATDGIEIIALDAELTHLQASIVGPANSPYEGGKFFLYIVVPQSYPMLPPTVRFLTKIVHPNVSRHGDVGVDIIQHNWSLALTISKILLSVQSLLTDPFTDICMEPALGRMYEENRPKFEALARSWTWKYAMFEVIPPD